MRVRTFGLVVAAVAVMAAPLSAQRAERRGQDAPGREAVMRVQRAQMPMRGGAMGAEYFLARTGELGLTDQQVVRLAAIARRAEARRVEQRANMPAMGQGMAMRMRGQGMGMRMRDQGAPADSANRETRAAAMQQMRTRMLAMREAREADLKDALAVLTPEQQAKVFMRVRN